MGSILNPYNDELYHHGILGQRKGIRRFQYLDGSLTPLGRLRYAKNREGKEERIAKAKAKKIAKEEAKKIAKAEAEAKKSKKVNPSQQAREMTYEDLKQAVSRLSLEKQYASLYNELNPQKKSIAKKFVEKAIDTSVKSITNAANRELSSALDELTKKASDKLKDKLREAAKSMKGK